MIVSEWSEWDRLKLTYPDHLTWRMKKKESLKNLLVSYTKKIVSLDQKETLELKIELSSLVNDLANGKRVPYRQIFVKSKKKSENEPSKNCKL